MRTMHISTAINQFFFFKLDFEFSLLMPEMGRHDIVTRLGGKAYAYQSCEINAKLRDRTMSNDNGSRNKRVKASFVTDLW